MKITIAKVQDQNIPFVAKAGFWGIDQAFYGYELREKILGSELDTAMTERYAKICDAGLAVGQTHLTYWPSHVAPLGDGSYEAYEEYFLPILEKEIAWTAKMGCRAAVMHPYFEADREKSREGNLRLFEKLLPVLRDCGVILSFENIYAKSMGEAWHSSAEDMLYYTDQIASPHLGLCLDTGHAIIRGQNPADFIEKIAPRLTALHLHTTLPVGDFHALPRSFNGDRIEWERIVQTLKNSGYEGMFNLEVAVPRKLGEKSIPHFYALAYCVAEELIQE